MKTRLRKLLHKLLQKDDISLESGIVNDLIYRMAQINFVVKKEDRDSGLQLGSWPEGETIEFTPPGMPMKQLNKLLSYFKTSEENYVTNTPITLDEHFVFDEFLPAFTAYYQTLKDENSPLITQYRVKSKPILESTAINTLKKYIEKTLELLLSDNVPQDTDGASLIKNALLEFYGKVDQLGNFPILYKSIIESETQIRHIRLINQNEEVEKSLALISEGIKLFTRYNRFESVLAIKSFMKEMETFLNSLKMSSERCDVIEETILDLIGAHVGKKGACKLAPGSDKSRLVFKFTDMPKDEAKKVIEYFQSMGDETATEGYGYGDYGSPLSDSEVRLESVSSASASRSTKPTEVLERHSIEVDGKFFYEKIFPQLKAHVNNMPSDKLDNYREASKEFLEEKAAKEVKATPNKNAMFQPAKQGTEEATTILELVV